MFCHVICIDVFDKLFFMSRGGVSKASKAINLSEDIFAVRDPLSLHMFRMVHSLHYLLYINRVIIPHCVVVRYHLGSI
jgi:hypothetical protein